MAFKMTPEYIESLVASTTFLRYKTLTLCVLELTNGTMVTGESNVIDPANYDLEIGEEMSRKDAISKIWSLEGYAIKREYNTAEQEEAQ